MDFAYRWSFSGGGSAGYGATPSSLGTKSYQEQDIICLTSIPVAVLRVPGQLCQSSPLLCQSVIAIFMFDSARLLPVSDQWQQGGENWGTGRTVLS